MNMRTLLATTVTALALITMTGCAVTRGQETVGAYVDDAGITGATVLTPVDDPRLEARLLERIWNGEIRFDVEAGQIVGRRTAIDRRVVGFGGPQSSVRYKASLEERADRPQPAP